MCQSLDEPTNFSEPCDPMFRVSFVYLYNRWIYRAYNFISVKAILPHVRLTAPNIMLFVSIKIRGFYLVTF